jgi:TQXA domain-containing protein
VINNAQDALYIMPYDDYVNAQSDEERKANAKIAYCFDHYLHWPASTANGYWRVDYTTTYLENRYSLYADTSDDASFKKDKNQIMAIALNGYPHNVSGIYTGQINEDAFRLVTQWAIWNYTDGDAVRSYFTAEEQKIFNYLTTTDLTTTLNNLQKLVDSSDAATAQSYINVYTSMGQAYDSATGQLVTSNDSAYKSDYGFQNLLVVGYRTNAINLPDGNLTVSKTVIGDTSNVSDTEFSFEAVFKSSGKAYTSGIAATFTSAKTSEKRTLTPGNDGKVTFKLKAGESVTMTLPAGVTYTVTEVDLPDNFTVFSPTGGSETGTIESSATKTVAFTNAYSGTLTVSKKVIGDTTGISVSDYGFKTITYFEQDGAAYTGPVLWTKDGTSTIFTSSAAGLAFTIKAGESYTMTVPAGVTYSSTESIIPSGFTMVKPSSGSFSGTIKAGTNAQAAFENRYGDEEETDGTLTVSKTVTGDTDNMPDTSFTFDAVFTKDNAAYTSDISATVTRTTGTTTETWTPDASGKKSFTLKNGESVTMMLPTGVTYTVTETNIPTDFTVTSPTNGSATDTMTSGAAETVDFTNAFTNTVNISGTKTWVGDDTTTRPSSITLGLYKHLDGTPESEDKLVSWSGFTNPFTFTPTNDSWTYTFSNKPMYEKGKLITYYVVEENVPDGYTFSYTASNGEANPAKSMNITNTYLKTVSLTLTKSVNEADELKTAEAKANRKFEFSIELKDKDGNPLTGTYPVTIADGVPTENLVAQTADGVQSYSLNLTDGTTKLYLRAEDSITINGLPEGYSYTITESGESSGSIDAYLTMIMVDYGILNKSTTRTISGSNVTKDTTNVKYLNQRYSLTLSKKVNGDYADADLDQAFAFKITLKDSNGNLITNQSYPVLPTTVSGVTNVEAPDIASVNFDANGEATISLKHGQSVILYNLPSGYKYTIQETGLDAQKYQTGYDVKNGKLYDNYTNTSSVSGEQVYYSEEVNCINKRIRQLYDIGLSKTVEGQFGDLNKVFTFKISLTAWDGTPVTGQLSVTASDEVAAQSGITDGKLAFTNGIASVSLKHGQSIVINGLQEGCQYQIQEELGSDSGYTTGIVVQPGDSSIAPITISGTETVTDTGLRTVAQNETVQYTNTMHDITPTGISTNVAQHAMFLMLMALLAGFVLNFRATRRRQH